jgi:hypothetical protein
MNDKPKYKHQDKKHFSECHERWMERRNRKTEEDGYKDEWWAEQCFSCKYFIPLSGAFANDYGACSNKKSPFDKQVMFEHDGCEFHQSIEDY